MTYYALKKQPSVGRIYAPREKENQFSYPTAKITLVYIVNMKKSNYILVRVLGLLFLLNEFQTNP